MTETEKYIKTAQSRSVTGNQEYEPEFTPFSFGTPTEEEKQTAFEVEKQYNFDKPEENVEEQINMEVPTFEKAQQNQTFTSSEIVAQSEIVARPRLNARGKIVASVFAVIVAIVIAFCIYNAVSINNLERVVAAKAEIVAEQTDVISQLQEEYNSLGEEDSIMSRLDGEYKRPEASDINKLRKFNMSKREQKEEQTNWFEKFCEKLRNLFS